MRRFLLLPALATFLLLPSCLIGGSSTVEASGRFISDETLARVEPGLDAGSVIALLGEPNSMVDLPSGNKTVWRYSYSRKTTSKGGVILIVGTESKTEESGAVFIEFADGKVSRTWRD